MLTRGQPRIAYGAAAVIFFLLVIWYTQPFSQASPPPYSEQDSYTDTKSSVSDFFNFGPQTVTSHSSSSSSSTHGPQSTARPLASKYEFGKSQVLLPVYTAGASKPLAEPYTRTLVMARMQSEDISWLDHFDLGTTRKAIYVVDNATLSPGYSIPQNKGHEAMVYLSYIIDYYDDLSDTNIFVHAHQYTWHNNDLLDSDTGKMITHLSDGHVARLGYFNLRCHEEPGCPDWLHLDRPDDQLDTFRKMEEKSFSLDVWHELHPGVKAPKAISQPCCAQFAVSRDRIRQNPKAEYVRYREWVSSTQLEDIFSGRVMEYSWHTLFTGEAEVCPDMSKCYCDGYGICFGGKREFDDWFETRNNSRNMNSEADKLEGNPDKVRELREQATTLERELEVLKKQAFERGDDPMQRAKEVGRVWNEGDGF